MDLNTYFHRVAKRPCRTPYQIHAAEAAAEVPAEAAEAAAAATPAATPTAAASVFNTVSISCYLIEFRKQIEHICFAGFEISAPSAFKPGLPKPLTWMPSFCMANTLYSTSKPQIWPQTHTYYRRFCSADSS